MDSDSRASNHGVSSTIGSKTKVNGWIRRDVEQRTPTSHVRKRFTKKVSSSPISTSGGNEEPDNLSELRDIIIECMRLASLSNETFLYAKQRLLSLNRELFECASSKFIWPLPNNFNIYKPQIPKGNVSRKRPNQEKKNAPEQQEKRARICRSCGEIASHDKRNCPLNTFRLCNEDDVQQPEKNSRVCKVCGELATHDKRTCPMKTSSITSFAVQENSKAQQEREQNPGKEKSKAQHERKSCPAKEKSRAPKERKPRLCRACGKLATHDKRNCPSSYPQL